MRGMQTRGIVLDQQHATLRATQKKLHPRSKGGSGVYHRQKHKENEGYTCHQETSSRYRSSDRKKRSMFSVKEVSAQFEAAKDASTRFMLEPWLHGLKTWFLSREQCLHKIRRYIFILQ